MRYALLFIVICALLFAWYQLGAARSAIWAIARPYVLRVGAAFLLVAVVMWITFSGAFNIKLL